MRYYSQFSLVPSPRMRIRADVRLESGNETTVSSDALSCAQKGWLTSIHYRSQLLMC